VADLLEIVLDEGKWLSASMTVALCATLAMAYRTRQSAVPVERRVAAMMDLFFGATIGTMAFGHLLAVSVKLAQGTLEGSPVGLYALGIVLALPSWTLVIHAVRRAGQGGTTLALNAVVAATLLAFGVHNLPLAAPAAFNIGYQLYSKRRLVGWAFVTLAVALNAALFIASLVFAASGQSFEQFSSGQ
jgi:hypothetical protein